MPGLELQSSGSCMQYRCHDLSWLYVSLIQLLKKYLVSIMQTSGGHGELNDNSSLLRNYSINYLIILNNYLYDPRKTSIITIPIVQMKKLRIRKLLTCSTWCGS